jgi:ABC-type glycerol-3-phosphate transport system permease component
VQFCEVVEVSVATAPAPAGHRRRPRLTVGRAILVLLMTAVTVVMLYPFGFMVNNSFKTQQQFDGAVSGHSLSSWMRLPKVIPVWREIVNSTIVCAAAIAIILAVSTIAGFAFAKLRYRASVLVFIAIIAAMLIPVQSIIIPAYVNFSKAHLLTGYWGAVLVYAALGTPFATFLMTTFYRGLPDDLVDAAIVDGLGYWGAFVRVALPMALPAIVTVTVLQFIQIWDDLLVGLLFLQNPSDRTITVGLGVLASGRTTDIPVLMAGSLMSALPAILVYVVFQRQLVSGLTAGMGK